MDLFKFMNNMWHGFLQQDRHTESLFLSKGFYLLFPEAIAGKCWRKKIWFCFPMLLSFWYDFASIKCLNMENTSTSLNWKKRFKKDTSKLSPYFPFVFIKPFYIFWFQIKETFVCSLLPNFWNDQFFAAFSGTKRWKFVSSVMSNCERLVAVLKKSLVLSFSD